MPRYLWGPDGRRWEIIYHQAFGMWEIVDFESCPFSLHYASLAGIAVPDLRRRRRAGCALAELRDRNCVARRRPDLPRLRVQKPL